MLIFEPPSLRIISNVTKTARRIPFGFMKVVKGNKGIRVAATEGVKGTPNKPKPIKRAIGAMQETLKRCSL
jgi:hypothetical protein